MKKITAYKGRKLSRVRKNAKVLSRESYSWSTRESLSYKKCWVKATTPI